MSVCYKCDVVLFVDDDVVHPLCVVCKNSFDVWMERVLANG